MKLCCEQFRSIEQDIQDKYYCIGATTFLLSFIESDYSIVFKNETLRIIYSPIEQVMNIDQKTAKALEILTNQVNHKETLFSILNRTHTVNGARMLKKSLVEPLTDEQSIRTRLDCVQELFSSPELFDEIESVLVKLDNLNVTSVVISYLFKLRKLDYETGKIALRYRKTAERNTKFNYEQAMNSLVQVYIKKREEIERLPDELTEEELRSLE